MDRRLAQHVLANIWQPYPMSEMNCLYVWRTVRGVKLAPVAAMLSAAEEDETGAHALSPCLQKPFPFDKTNTVCYRSDFN